MLNIYIEKLVQVEGGVFITARVPQPFFTGEKHDFKKPEEYESARAEHDKRTEEYSQLHLGNAHLEQIAGD